MGEALAIEFFPAIPVTQFKDIPEDQLMPVDEKYLFEWEIEPNEIIHSCFVYFFPEFFLFILILFY